MIEVAGNILTGRAGSPVAEPAYSVALFSRTFL